jgi:hypothetical protein
MGKGVAKNEWQEDNNKTLVVKENSSNGWKKDAVTFSRS